MHTDKHTYTSFDIPSSNKTGEKKEEERNDLNTMDILLLLRKFIVAQNPTIHYGGYMECSAHTFISF